MRAIMEACWNPSAEATAEQLKEATRNLQEATRRLQALDEVERQRFRSLGTIERLTEAFERLQRMTVR